MTHIIRWLDPNGAPLTVLKDFTRLEYLRAEGKVGWLKLDLDPLAIDTSLLRVNMRLEPWRSTFSITPYLDGDSQFFLQSWGWKTDAQGVERLHLEAYDGNFIVAQHIVDEYSGTAGAAKTDYADDMLKAIIREQMGSLATDTARDLSTWMSVQADLSAGPSITKAFSWRDVLAAINEIVNDSTTQGTYATFDTVKTGDGTMELRTYTGQRGVDHGQSSAQPVVFSKGRKNLVTPEYTEDHSEEANYIYVGGRGTATTQMIGNSQHSRRNRAEPAREVCMGIEH